MAKKPIGYKKCLDLLECGNELIAVKKGTRGQVEAFARKLDNVFILRVGTSTSRSSDANEFMQDLRDFTDFTNWLAIEPEDKTQVVTKQVKVLTMDVGETKKKTGRRG